MMRKDCRAEKQWDGLSNRAFRYIAPDFVNANELHVTG